MAALHFSLLHFERALVSYNSVTSLYFFLRGGTNFLSFPFPSLGLRGFEGLERLISLLYFEQVPFLLRFRDPGFELGQGREPRRYTLNKSIKRYERKLKHLPFGVRAVHSLSPVLR